MVWVHPELLVLRVYQDCLAPLVPKALKVARVVQDYQAQQDHKDLLAQLDL